MAISERSRQHLISALQAQLGDEAAMTLIEHLPPGGWSEVATHHDLTQLETRIDLRFETMEQRFAGMERHIDQRFTAMDQNIDQRFAATEARILGTLDQRLATQMRSMVVVFVTALISFGGLLLAALSIAS